MTLSVAACTAAMASFCIAASLLLVNVCSRGIYETESACELDFFQNKCFQNVGGRRFELLRQKLCQHFDYETVKEFSKDEPVLQQAALPLLTINFCFDLVVVLGGREGLESLKDGLLVEVLGLRGLVWTFWNGISPH